MTLMQKMAAREKLRAAFGPRVTREIAGRTGFTQNYIRDWFRQDFAQPKIERQVVEMLKALDGYQNELQNLLNVKA
jgi:hypothetical protein